MALRHWVGEELAGCRGGIEAHSSRWGTLASFTELDSDLSHIGVICPTEEWTWGGKFETA